MGKASSTYWRLNGDAPERRPPAAVEGSWPPEFRRLVESRRHHTRAVGVVAQEIATVEQAFEQVESLEVVQRLVYLREALKGELRRALAGLPLEELN